MRRESGERNATNSLHAAPADTVCSKPSSLAGFEFEVNRKLNVPKAAALSGSGGGWLPAQAVAEAPPQKDWHSTFNSFWVGVLTHNSCHLRGRLPSVSRDRKF